LSCSSERDSYHVFADATFTATVRKEGIKNSTRQEELIKQKYK